MKIRLLDDADLLGMSDIKFPVVIESSDIEMDPDGSDNVLITGKDLVLIGADESCFILSVKYHFAIGTECEVIK